VIFRLGNIAPNGTIEKGEGQMTNEGKLSARTGMYFEEFEVGLTSVSPARTITESDIWGFAALSGDWNAIHTDAVHAASHPFGQRVAHGLLLVGIASGLVMRQGFLEGTALAFREIESWKFSLPVFIGDTICVRTTVTGTKPMARLGGGMVTVKVEILNQEDKVVQRGSWSVLVQGRE
jgi:acyl dehydratase